MISVSEIKDAIEPKCPISPAVMHFFLEETRKGRHLPESAKQKERPNRSRSSLEGKNFHKKHSGFLRKISEPDNSVDKILNGLKETTLDFAINSTIYSRNGIVGKPDIIFHTFNSVKLVELKKRYYPSNYGHLDKLQVETCMLMLEDGILYTIPNKLKIDLEGKRIEGYVLYGNGKLVEVEPENTDLIRLKALETLEMINSYKSVYDLPKPDRCNPACGNINYCAKKGLIPYENTPASPGGIEGKGPAYLARA